MFMLLIIIRFVVSIIIISNIYVAHKLKYGTKCSKYNYLNLIRKAGKSQ